MESKKIRILHFPIRNSNGGVTRNAMKYWKYIDHNKFQFGFATCSSQLDFEQDIIEQGCKVHYISCYAEENPEQFKSELRDILLGEYDAIHINTNWWKSFYAEQVAKETGIKLILVHARNTFVDVNDAVQREKAIVEHEKHKALVSEEMATYFLACSNEAADFLFGSQIPREKIKIFHNALDIDRYTYDGEKREAVRSKLNMANKFVIGNVGRLSYQKNHEFLIDIFYEVQKKVDNAVLMLIGEGELESKIREKAYKYGIMEKVLFLGMKNNVEDYLQAMDIFVFPTRFEGLPNVLVEAQAAGLKCLCSANVTKEVKLTDNVMFLDLEKEKWVDKILQYSDGYKRVKTDEQIRAAGYDIRCEIKELEEIYSSVNR
jgi:glycosyltransferase involved in cell wall biosynthesis